MHRIDSDAMTNRRDTADVVRYPEWSAADRLVWPEATSNEQVKRLWAVGDSHCQNEDERVPRYCNSKLTVAPPPRVPPHGTVGVLTPPGHETWHMKRGGGGFKERYPTAILYIRTTLIRGPPTGGRGGLYINVTFIRGGWTMIGWNTGPK